jgi:hypothetical protein
MDAGAGTVVEFLERVNLKYGRKKGITQHVIYVL